MTVQDKEPAATVRPSSVLFLCGQNAIRSPLAESLARSLLPRDVFIASAGVRAGERDPFVDAVLSESGLGRREAAPRIFDPSEDGYFDLIVTLAPEAHHAALELTRTVAVDVEYWPTPDPSAVTGTRNQIMDAYRDVRDRLAARIEERFGTGARKMPDE
jgi:protein-tyrosine-phosphatase